MNNLFFEVLLESMIFLSLFELINIRFYLRVCGFWDLLRGSWTTCRLGLVSLDSLRIIYVSNIANEGWLVLWHLPSSWCDFRNLAKIDESIWTCWMGGVGLGGRVHWERLNRLFFGVSVERSRLLTRFMWGNWKEA